MGLTALLVIDVQKAMVRLRPYRFESVEKSIGRLLEAFRAKGLPVIFVRHDDGVDTVLEYGAEGWEIHDGIKPLEEESIIDKRFNSAFHGTNLKELLDARGITTLVITGLQTELCVDATLKGAFDRGYRIWVPEDAHSTFDDAVLSAEQIRRFYTRSQWPGRYAEVLSDDAVIERL